MGAMKNELHRIAESIVYGDYETIAAEFKKAEELGADSQIFALIVDMAKVVAPNCNCGSDYFEGIKK